MLQLFLIAYRYRLLLVVAGGKRNNSPIEWPSIPIEVRPRELCEGFKNIFSDISDYIRASFTCLHSLHSSLLGVKE